MTTDKNHNIDLYSIILTLSRNIFFYKKINLPDTFETRIYLMFFHFSIMMIVSKKKGLQFDQYQYDQFFKNIEYNLRELGFGDVSVNSKMKELNKISYDILLKLQLKDNKNLNIFKLNESLVYKYFMSLNSEKNLVFIEFELYFRNFYNYCFDQSIESMIEKVKHFKY